MVAQRSRVALVFVGYTALRLLLFALPFFVIWAFSGNPTISAVFAAVIGLALSVILLDPQRRALAGLVGDRVDRRRPSSDEAVEDRELDGQTDSAAASPRP